ncbi:hypothetical protein B0J14DRAFT_328270 [Halenospora varia]|nr:hypothetical protein B0J14DRAFT_328270 [Halenospora varia]
MQAFRPSSPQPRVRGSVGFQGSGLDGFGAIAAKNTDQGSLNLSNATIHHRNFSLVRPFTSRDSPGVPRRTNAIHGKPTMAVGRGVGLTAQCQQPSVRHTKVAPCLESRLGCDAPSVSNTNARINSSSLSRHLDRLEKRSSRASTLPLHQSAYRKPRTSIIHQTQVGALRCALRVTNISETAPVVITCQTRDKMHVRHGKADLG